MKKTMVWSLQMTMIMGALVVFGILVPCTLRPRTMPRHPHQRHRRYFKPRKRQTTAITIQPISKRLPWQLRIQLSVLFHLLLRNHCLRQMQQSTRRTASSRMAATMTTNPRMRMIVTRMMMTTMTRMVVTVVPIIRMTNTKVKLVTRLVDTIQSKSVKSTINATLSLRSWDGVIFQPFGWSRTARSLRQPVHPPSRINSLRSRYKSRPNITRTLPWTKSNYWIVSRVNENRRRHPWHWIVLI
mmetsp:Transcript_4052/g.6774  ORF Transcript_4052/g.6774 Transcript_4052/m.6774 type:complete len:242 (-) Transcript_4052:2277-3002(-)